jgi:hypothetical protein
MSIRSSYEKYGVDDYYQTFGNEYSNPHIDRLTESLNIVNHSWKLNTVNSLDLCAGGGEITSVLGCTEGCDPYTHELYRKNTGNNCYEYSFDDIMHGKLTKKYDTIICSYALHLAEPSKLPQIIYQLSCICKTFLLITPNKKPLIKNEWGMRLNNEAYINGIRFKLYETI